MQGVKICRNTNIFQEIYPDDYRNINYELRICLLDKLFQYN